MVMESEAALSYVWDSFQTRNYRSDTNCSLSFPAKPVISLLQTYSSWDSLKNPRHTNTSCSKAETLLSFVKSSGHNSLKIPGRLCPLLSGVTQEAYS